MGKYIDLSLDIFDQAKTFDVDPTTEIIQFNTIDSIGYNISKLCMSSHFGTHVDAPRHFIRDGNTVDKINLSKFVGKAAIIDLSSKKAGEFIDAEDLAPYQSKFQKDAKIILRTDWGFEYGKETYFSLFPRLTKKAGEWIADTGIGLLGLETPSVNPVDYKYIHEVVLDRQIVILEGLTNVRSIPRDEFTLIALPLKVRNGDGSPVRAVALID
jgi:arylformamidase